MNKKPTKPETDVWSKYEKIAWRLPSKLTVTEWCDKYRFLSPRSSAEPGKYRSDRTPYVKEIMNCFSDDFVEEITMMFGTQLGKTEIIFNLLAYTIDQVKAPALVVLPTQDLCRSLSTNRFRPMIECSPQLKQHLPFKKDEVSIMELRLKTCTVAFAGSNSPSALSSRPIQILCLDETDKFPLRSGTEASPIALARERTRTFWNRKIVKSSTPTTESGYINKEFGKSDRRSYHVPCPHCDTYQVLIFPNVRWENSKDLDEIQNTDSACWYECKHCKEKIFNKHKNQMLLSGIWCPEGCTVVKGKIIGEVPVTNHRGFHLSSLYSPWLRFGDIAVEFLKSEDDPSLLMNFKNSWEAIPWVELTRRRTDPEDIARHQTSTPYAKGSVPDPVQVITAGVDVQLNRLYYVIMGWAYNKCSYLIRSGSCASFDELYHHLIKTTYGKANGQQLAVRLALCDSGYRTSEVYAWTRQDMNRLRPSKGQRSLYGVPFKANILDKHAVTGKSIPGSQTLWHVDTTYYKNSLHQVIHNPLDNPTQFYVYSGIEQEYCDHLASEENVLTTNKSDGKTVGVWRPRGGARGHANHLLDCTVYSMCAGDIIRVGMLRPPGETTYQPQPLAQPDRNKQSFLGDMSGFMSR